MDVLLDLSLRIATRILISRRIACINNKTRPHMNDLVFVICFLLCLTMRRIAFLHLLLDLSQSFPQFLQ